MAAEPLLPIKVVFPSDSDYKPPDAGGGKDTVFVDVTPELRERLATEVRTVKKHFRRTFTERPHIPAVGRVQLRPEALAKTHRPSRLFNEDTCPVIGLDDMGQLLISVTEQGIDSVESGIRVGTQQEVIANISAIEAILPWTDSDVRRGMTSREILDVAADSPRLHKPSDPKAPAKPSVRCELFRFPTAAINVEIRRAFMEMVQELGLPAPREVPYTPGSSVFELRDATQESLDELSGLVGIQRLGAFPVYRIERTREVLGTLTADHLPPPLAGENYPLVGIIDSGTDRNNLHLQAWVDDRLDLIPAELQANDHGSFVAGLLAGARSLNHGDARFPSTQCRIVDVVVFDRDGRIDEDDLLRFIDKAIEKYPAVKVWNLSLGGPTCCDARLFSDFGAALDARTRQHGVLFVVAAGNYEQRPLRSWPPSEEPLADRICPPADAVRALTVGSIAHQKSAATVADVGDPSPFSRRGPAPGFLVKPDLTHIGGNCSADGAHMQTGVVSVGENGTLAEAIGTSFATPLVSATASGISHELAAAGDVSPILVKALAVHSALLAGIPESLTEMHYHGAGVPAEVSDVLACTQSSATLLLQLTLGAQGYFEKRPFPMPDCLVRENGKLNGEVFMTVAHDVPVDQQCGFEYCRSNVEVSLGTWRPNKKSGGMRQAREVNPVPNSPGQGIERYLIEHGYKWSPLKIYHRRFKRLSPDHQWRLRINRLDRAEYRGLDEQTVFILITVVDPDGTQPVYNEMVRQMQQLGWAIQDLEIRNRQRLRT